jgi:hypothetical protein
MGSSMMESIKLLDEKQSGQLNSSNMLPPYNILNNAALLDHQNQDIITL